MASRVLLFVFLLTTGCFIADAQAQTSSGTSATSSAAPTSKASKQEMRAAKKAERIAKRKKRAGCYDQAKKDKVADKDLSRYISDCVKK